jgi:hypothetical protein
MIPLIDPNPVGRVGIKSLQQRLGDFERTGGRFRENRVGCPLGKISKKPNIFELFRIEFRIGLIPLPQHPDFRRYPGFGGGCGPSGVGFPKRRPSGY